MDWRRRPFSRVQTAVGVSVGVLVRRYSPLQWDRAMLAHRLACRRCVGGDPEATLAPVTPPGTSPVSILVPTPALADASVSYVFM